MGKEKDAYLMCRFSYDTLPKRAQEVCRPFFDTAQILFKILPEGPERQNVLKKLLDVKEYAVDTMLMKDVG